LAYFEEQYPAGEKGLRKRLQNVVESDFARISYTEAVQLLQSEIASGKVVFENPVSWGGDLNSEHERYLSEKVSGGWEGEAMELVSVIVLPSGGLMYYC
jgi:aspartyl/asparaginyl-tRNA synthetase